MLGISALLAIGAIQAAVHFEEGVLVLTDENFDE